MPLALYQIFRRLSHFPFLASSRVFQNKTKRLEKVLIAFWWSEYPSIFIHLSTLLPLSYHTLWSSAVPPLATELHAIYYLLATSILSFLSFCLFIYCHFTSYAPLCLCLFCRLLSINSSGCQPDAMHVVLDNTTRTGELWDQRDQLFFLSNHIRRLHPATSLLYGATMLRCSTPRTVV